MRRKFWWTKKTILLKALGISLMNYTSSYWITCILSSTVSDAWDYSSIITSSSSILSFTPTPLRFLSSCYLFFTISGNWLYNIYKSVIVKFSKISAFLISVLNPLYYFALKIESRSFKLSLWVVSHHVSATFDKSWICL